MKSIFALVTIALLNSLSALAGEVTTIPQVGNHFPILIVEKNVNPQNKMVVYTKLDSGCNFLNDESKSPIFDFYWLMNGTSYKPVHPMIKAEVHKRLSVSTGNQSKVFYATINDLKELNHDLPDARMTITGRAQGNGCNVEGFLTLGPSDNNATIRVSSIYTEAKGLVMPRVVSVTIKGTVVSSGQAISRTYYAP